MFEQAVYAGRNHTAILAVAAALAGSAPAHAASDVARVPLGSRIRSLVAGPDGGAWIGIQHRSRGAIGRAGADGSFRSTPTSSGRATERSDPTVRPGSASRASGWPASTRRATWRSPAYWTSATTCSAAG